MQCLRKCIQQFVSNNAFTPNNSNSLSSILRTTYIIPSSNMHGSPALNKDKPSKFLDYNKVIFPPQKPGEERRPGFVCHKKPDIKYSPEKMWYIACFIRGMSIDEALRQLSFLPQKGATAVKETLLEAQRMAVEEHNIEFKSNLWVAESFATKAGVMHGLRRHGKMRIYKVAYRYTHYFVRLEEGTPPKHYYLPTPKNGEEMLQDWLTKMRRRKVFNSL